MSCGIALWAGAYFIEKSNCWSQFSPAIRYDVELRVAGNQLFALLVSAAAALRSSNAALAMTLKIVTPASTVPRTVPDTFDLPILAR